MTTVAVIPCRYDSQRLPGKPLAMILGKPMIQWVYERVKKAQGLSEVVVATDDSRIDECCQAFGAKVIMTEKGLRSGTDRAAQAASLLGLANSDMVINVQGDQPTVAPQCLTQAVDALLKNYCIDMSSTMSTLIYKIVDPREIDDSNHVKCVFDHNNYALYFSRCPIPFQRDAQEDTKTDSTSDPAHAHARAQAEFVDRFKHLGVYAYRKDFLDRFAALPTGKLEHLEKLEQIRALEYGLRVKVVETQYDSIEVDNLIDIEKAEAILSRQG